MDGQTDTFILHILQLIVQKGISVNLIRLYKHCEWFRKMLIKGETLSTIPLCTECFTCIYYLVIAALFSTYILVFFSFVSNDVIHFSSLLSTCCIMSICLFQTSVVLVCCVSFCWEHQFTVLWNATWIHFRHITNPAWKHSPAITICHTILLHSQIWDVKDPSRESKKKLNKYYNSVWNKRAVMA